jgi:cation transport regulator ChaC
MFGPRKMWQPWFSAIEILNVIVSGVIESYLLLMATLFSAAARDGQMLSLSISGLRRLRVPLQYS